MQNWLPYLLHLSDPTLPIGAYTHSGGLETYVQQGLVKNVAEAGAFIRNMLFHNLPYNDGLFAVLAYRMTAEGDTAALIQLDHECTALKAPKELRMASQRLGMRLLKLMSPLLTHTISSVYLEQIRKGEASGHYCLAFGMYACIAGIPLSEAITAYYYNTVTGMVTNSVKLIPLGQQQGQEMLYELLPVLPALVEQTLHMPRELAGRCCIGFDIRSMQHERLYSRLYMS